MAAEAVYKIKETEDKGKEAIKKANEEAKKILAEAKENSVKQKQSVLEEALRKKAAMIQSAVERANKRCEEISAEGAEEREKLLSPDSARLERAIQLVMERIVSV